MPVPHLSLRAARHLHLAAQGLLQKPRRRARAEDIKATISRMSLLQIDTINVVARSPYLVLFSRLGDYPPFWLDDALACGDIFEYWAHEACFIPREDFGLVRHNMLQPEKMGWKYRAAWMQEHEQDIAQLLEHVRLNGPVRSADFAHPQKGAGGWWAWKPHKRHLEGLFTAGKLMVKARHNFQRIYDLTERVQPQWDDARDLPTREAAQRQMLLNSARSLGIFQPAWLADYYRLRNVALAPLLMQWQEQGEIIAVEVERLGAMWLHQSLVPLLERAQAGALRATHSAVLSPFDPVVWDRKRAEQFFDFRYRLECYTPAAKRQYGYFVLPLLHRGALVGRMDARMHRKAGYLDVINLWLEASVKPGAGLMAGLERAIEDFARWQGAHAIRFTYLPDVLAAHLGKHREISAGSVLS